MSRHVSITTVTELMLNRLPITMLGALQHFVLVAPTPISMFNVICGMFATNRNSCANFASS